MDTQVLSFQSFFAFLLFVFVVSKTLKRSSTTGESKHLNLPPGPKKLPFIGNLHNMVGSLPHHALRDLANQYGPAMFLKLGEVPTLVISSPDMAKEVMKNHDINFAQRPPLLAVEVGAYKGVDIAFAPYGDYWRQIRKICVLELLSSKRVHSFRPIRAHEMKNFIDYLTSCSVTGSVVNLSEKLLDLSYYITGCAAFGEKCRDHEAFIKATKVSLEMAGGFCFADVFPSFKLLHWITGERQRIEKHHHEVDVILDNIINDHKDRKTRQASGSDDVDKVDCLLEVLLNLQQTEQLEFPLEADNVKAIILDMFVAGSETSAATTEWAMSELLKKPRLMEKAQAEVRELFDKRGGVVEETFLEELKFLKLTIKETLRLHPPLALLLPRECREPTKIKGFDIPVKTKVIINGWAIGRDPSSWNEPDRFMPERFVDSPVDYKGTNFELLPFGSGRRMCPGMLFGTTKVEYELASLLYHFDWKLPPGVSHVNLDMSEKFGVSVRRKSDLLAIPVSYRMSK